MVLVVNYLMVLESNSRRRDNPKALFHALIEEGCYKSICRSSIGISKDTSFAVLVCDIGVLEHATPLVVGQGS